MKNIIFTGASLLALAIASPALAQSTSDIDQTGNSNGANVTQSGSNDSDVDQVGNSNAATVGQSGTGGESNILQTGNSNRANTTQNTIGGLADVIQSGNSNQSDITQTDANAGGALGVAGKDPEAFVNQQGNSNISGVTQSNSAVSFDLIANVNQNGDSSD